MKLLFDFFPVFIFFIAYKIYGFYIATAAFIVASVAQVSIYWLKHRRFETMHIIMLAFVVLLGGATLLLHDEMFLKWKPTVVYWIFTVVFLGTQFIGKKTLIQRMMESKISLPRRIWVHLNISWALFFALMGVANLYVVYNFSTDAWVNFKLFGTLGLTFLFVLLQAFYMSKYIDQHPANSETKKQ